MPLDQVHPHFEGRPIPTEIDPFADPPYRRKATGTLLVIGSALRMEVDYKRALALRPNAATMGIRRTAEFMPCDMCFSLDREKLHRPLMFSQAVFGHRPEMHSAVVPAGKTKEAFAGIVDYWWPGAQGGGTSAWAGAKVGLFMGYEEIILCGAPIAPTPYCNGQTAPTFLDEKNLANMRRAIEADTWMHDLVTSMSGWTRDFLGEPK